MNLEILGISVLWTFLFGYILIGAIDFGAGFFNAYSLLTGKKTNFNKYHSALFISGVGSNECFSRFLLCRDHWILSENSILLRDDVIGPCQYRDYLTRDSRFVLCV